MICRHCKCALPRAFAGHVAQRAALGSWIKCTCHVIIIVIDGDAQMAAAAGAHVRVVHVGTRRYAIGLTIGSGSLGKVKIGHDMETGEVCFSL